MWPNKRRQIWQCLTCSGSTSPQSIIHKRSGKRWKRNGQILNIEAAQGHRGARRLPIWLVQFICELLVDRWQNTSECDSREHTNYVPDSSIRREASVNFIQGCRVVVQVAGETITALKLAAAEKRKQLWTDAICHNARQIPFTALTICWLEGIEYVVRNPIFACSNFIGGWL